MPRIVDVDRRRSELTDAAARVIARAGLDGTTMREVAREAGWTTGVLTHYFADKRELLLATYRASLDGRRAVQGTAGSSPLDELRRALDGALPVDEERRRHWLVTLACTTQAVDDPELALAQRDAYREYRDRIARLVRAAGLADGAAAGRRAEQLIAVADGIAVQAILDPDHWSARRQRDALSAALTTELGER